MNKKHDYYLASGWFSEDQEKNYELTSSSLKQKFNIFEPRLDAGNLAEGPMTLERAKEIFKNDLIGIDSCKGIFADISFRDTGVLIEIGYAIKGKMIKEKYHKLKEDFKNNIITEDQFLEEKENLLENGVDEITLFDNSTRPKMNIMIASAADNCIRNDIELQDYVNGEKVFDLGSTELE